MGPEFGARFFYYRQPRGNAGRCVSVRSIDGGSVMGYFIAFFLLGVAGAVWSRTWDMSGKTALVIVGVPYAVYFLAGCSP